MTRGAIVLAVSACLIVVGGILAVVLQAAGILEHHHPCDDPSCGWADDDHGRRP